MFVASRTPRRWSPLNHRLGRGGHTTTGGSRRASGFCCFCWGSPGMNRSVARDSALRGTLSVARTIGTIASFGTAARPCRRSRQTPGHSSPVGSPVDRICLEHQSANPPGRHRGRAEPEDASGQLGLVGVGSVPTGDRRAASLAGPGVEVEREMPRSAENRRRFRWEWPMPSRSLP